MFSNTIQDVAQFHAKNMFLAMDMCGQAITSAAIATNATFPFVTVPNFEVLGAATRAQSGIEMLLWQPILVNDKTTEKWIDYSLQNQGWVNESRALAIKNAEQQGSNNVTSSSANYIYNSIPDFIWDRDENLVMRPTVAEPSYIPYVSRIVAIGFILFCCIPKTISHRDLTCLLHCSHQLQQLN